MVILSFSYLNKHTVFFDGFIDDMSIFHQPKEISFFYPGYGIADIEILGKNKLKEFVRDGFYHNKPDSFCMDFDGEF